jgi:hypothetical protein
VEAVAMAEEDGMLVEVLGLVEEIISSREVQAGLLDRKITKVEVLIIMEEVLMEFSALGQEAMKGTEIEVIMDLGIIEVLIVVIMVVKGTTTIADSTMGMLPVMHLIGI